MATNDTKTLFASLVKAMAPVRNGLISLFSSMPGNVSEATEIEFDVIKEKASVSWAKNRTGQPNVNSDNVFKSVTVKPPIYKEACLFSMTELEKRQPGYIKYAVGSAEQITALSEFTAQKVSLLLAKIMRAETLQVANILNTGTIPFQSGGFGKGVEDLDFRSPSGNFATVANAAAATYYWDNAAALPFTMLETHCRTIRAASGGRTRIRKIFIGKTALGYFYDNTSVQERLNNLRMNLGLIEAKTMDAGTGIGYIGTFMLDGGMVDLLTFDEEYNALTGGTSTPYLNAKACYFVGDGDYQVFHAGIDTVAPLTDVDVSSIVGDARGAVRMIGGREAAQIFVFTSVQDNNVLLNVQKAPLYVPKLNDTFGRLTVLA